MEAEQSINHSLKQCNWCKSDKRTRKIYKYKGREYPTHAKCAKQIYLAHDKLCAVMDRISYPLIHVDDPLNILFHFNQINEDKLQQAGAFARPFFDYCGPVVEAKNHLDLYQRTAINTWVNSLINKREWIVEKVSKSINLLPMTMIKEKEFVSTISTIPICQWSPKQMKWAFEIVRYLDL